MEHFRPLVALLIDGDNSASVSIPTLLTEVGKLGDVMMRRVYGNWSLTSLVAGQEVALAHYPSCRFRSSPQWGYLLATSSLKSP
jgi:hypothetical protein